jgi:hypothetical protein
VRIRVTLEKNGRSLMYDSRRGTAQEPKMANPKDLDDERATRCRRQIALATIAAVIIIAGLWRTAAWLGWLGS